VSCLEKSSPYLPGYIPGSSLNRRVVGRLLKRRDHLASRASVMLVEDEPDLLATTKSMLETSGYEVHAFDSPDEAIRHVKDEGCKACVLVVSDVRMPGMSGFELVRRIKEIQPETKVVLMSSFIIHRDEFKKVMPSLQIDDFVSKPFTKDDIIEAIRKCVKTPET